MRRSLIVTGCVVCLFTASAVRADDDVPRADTAPPTLASFALATVGTAAADNPITLTYIAADDESGVASVRFHYTDPLGQRRTVTGDATGPAVGSVDAAWPSGRYRLDATELTDNAANSITYFFDGATTTSTRHALSFSDGDVVVDSGAPPTVKAPQRGVVLTQLPARELLPTFNAIVARVDWADLQPEQDGPITHPNAIDTALAQLRGINAREPSLGLTLKIRVMAGRGAPSWAQNIGGSPIATYDPVDDVGSTIGRFWLPEFGSAYDDLMTKLATLYDGVAEVRDVVIDRCMTTWAEPFIRHAAHEANRERLLAAGFSTAADHTCHREQIATHAVWSTTHSSLAGNPYEQVNDDGTWTKDEPFTEAMFDYCAEVLGARCVLENNSLRHPAFIGPYEAMYSKMAAMDQPVTFQTAKPRSIGSTCAALVWALSQHADSVEMNTDYVLDDSQAATLRAFDRGLQGVLPLDVAPPAAPTQVAVQPRDGARTVTWTAAEDDFGVACYRVTRDGAVIAWPMTSTFTDTGVAPGLHTYAVEAIDGAGNIGAATSVQSYVAPPPTTDWTTTQDNELAVTYGGWGGSVDPTALGGGVRTSRLANDSVRYRFSGTAVTWLTRKGPDQGQASVTIDGKSKGVVDLYGASPQAQVQVSFAGLAQQAHTVIVKTLGKKNASSTGTGVAVDGFSVGNTTVQETANAVTLNSWAGAATKSASGGSYRSSKERNATATFAFRGTGVDWITATGNRGTARVTIDGVDKGTFDLYAAKPQWRVAKRCADLPAGTHTIVVTVLGTKHAKSTSTSVVVDAFAVR